MADSGLMRKLQIKADCGLQLDKGTVFRDFPKTGPLRCFCCENLCWRGRLLVLELSNWTCWRLRTWLPYIDWKEPWMLLEIADITESKLLLLRWKLFPPQAIVTLNDDCEQWKLLLFMLQCFVCWTLLIMRILFNTVAGADLE